MIALVFLTLAAPAILLSFWFEHPLAEWLFAALAMGFPVALIALGGSRREGLGRLRIPLVVLLVLFETSLVGILVLHGRAGPWGYPLTTLVLIVGMWFLPLLVTAWGYAQTFAESGIDDALVERLEKMKND